MVRSLKIPLINQREGMTGIMGFDFGNSYI
jgi:hypothetical protein